MDIVLLPSAKEKFTRGFFDIPYFCHEILEEETHAEQDAALRALRPPTQETGIVTGNRWGKGDTIKLFGAWLATYKPVSSRFKSRKLNILNTSISQDQANIVFDKFEDTLLSKPHWSFLIKFIKKSPFPHIMFKTGVCWWFRNASQQGKFLEGRSYFYANFDEADLQDDFMRFCDDILMPRLWDFAGTFSWTTTPRRRKRNAYKRWELLTQKVAAGDSSAVAFRGDSRNNKFLDARAIDKMNQLPERLKNKNVKGIFDDTDGCIQYDALDFCEKIAAGLLSEKESHHRYVSSWDFARTHTFNVGVTVEIADPLQLRSIERTQDPGRRNKAYWQDVTQAVRRRNERWPGITALDATGLGDVLSSFLSDMNHIPVNFGVKQTRDDIIDTGVACVQSGGIGIPLSDPRLNVVTRGQLWCARDELLDFEPSSLDGLVWDFVCALFIAIYIAKGKKPKRPGHKSDRRASPALPLLKGASKYAIS